MAHPGMYRGDRRRKEDQRKAKQEAKKARRAERRDSGTSGPEIAEPVEPEATAREFVWFSPSKGRTVTTTSKAAPLVEGIDDWMLLSEPPSPAAG